MPTRNKEKKERIALKKFVSLMLAAVMLLSMASFASAEDAVRVAMITDSGDITDQSFNQTTYEACKAFCEAKGIDFKYYKPAGDSDPERVAMIDAAVEDGFNVIVLPGFLFAPAIAECQPMYPEVKFIALDVSEYDLSSNGVNVAEAANLYSAVYQEELSGYMAGVAAVKLGYKHLGFLGGMAVPAVIRFGYGFVQGANDAAKELGLTDVAIEYVYGNQFYGDADITAYMDNWYQTMGVEVVFACGGGIYSSAAEAAQKVGGKVIGVDTDQSGVIDGAYGEGLTVTSAMKGLAATVNTMLKIVVDGEFDKVAGQVENLGLVSAEDPELNYVQIPMASTQWTDSFTQDDYKALVAAMFDGTITVSAATDVEPTVDITVNYYGNVK